MPNGPQTPSFGSASAPSRGPNTSPLGSTEPSIASTMRPRDRRRPAFRADAHPVPGSRPSTSTSSPHRSTGAPVTSATTYWARRPPAYARNAAIARSMSSGQPSQTQWTLTSIVAGSSRTLGTSAGASGCSASVATGSRRNVPSGSSTTVQPADAIRSRIASACPKSFAARACARCSPSRTSSSGASGIAVSLDEIEDQAIDELWPLRPEDVSGPFEEPELRTRDPTREQLGVARRDDPILGPVQHQRRHGDLRESVERVPRLHRLPLSPLPAWMVGLGGRDTSILAHHIGMRLEEAGRVESAPRLSLRDGPVGDRDRMRRTGMRPREFERPDAVGVLERGLLRHHAAERLTAERLTVDVCALDVELVEDGERVLDEGRHRARSGRVVARTVASVIDRDDPELTGEFWDAPPPPGDVGADALQQSEHRGTRIAEELVVD